MPNGSKKLDGISLENSMGTLGVTTYQNPYFTRVIFHCELSKILSQDSRTEFLDGEELSLFHEIYTRFTPENIFKARDKKIVLST